MSIGPKEIEAACAALKPFVDRTPLVGSRALHRRTGVAVYLKLENLQKTGSFKVRGAFNRMRLLTAAERRNGVVAASAGNHAQGVALAANTLRIPATIVMPLGASISKQEATRSYGARVILEGHDFEQATRRAQRMAREERKVLIHAFDDEGVIAGQGTVGVEILQDLPTLATLVVPVGGGGIAAGIGIAAKAIKPKVQLIGVTARSRPTLADGIAVKGPGKITGPLLERYLDQAIDVSDEEIAEAILLLIEHKRIIAEGAGAVPLAALLHHGRRMRAPVGLVVTGGNIDPTLIERIIERGLVRTGRLLRLSAILDDRPGALARLSGTIGELGANILHIVHDRLSSGLPLTQSRVHLSLETRGPEHNEQIIRRLRRDDYPIDV